MNLREYPSYALATLKDAVQSLEQITNIRKDDIFQAKNLPQTFILGRKVGRVPSASNDVIDGDKSGDFNYDLNYIYILVGTAWRRATLGAW